MEIHHAPPRESNYTPTDHVSPLWEVMSWTKVAVANTDKVVVARTLYATYY